MAASETKVLINRAPVLTLWGAVVAERLGFEWSEALSLGKAIAGLTAQAKGQRLGIFTPRSPEEVERTRREAEKKAQFAVSFMGRAIPVTVTPGGLRAVLKDRVVEPESVERYVRAKFGAHYEAALDAMRALAWSKSPSELADEAFRLYERFRPRVPEGVRGWGAKGELSLARIRALADRSA